MRYILNNVGLLRGDYFQTVEDCNFFLVSQQTTLLSCGSMIACSFVRSLRCQCLQGGNIHDEYNNIASNKSMEIINKNKGTYSRNSFVKFAMTLGRTCVQINYFQVLTCSQQHHSNSRYLGSPDTYFVKYILLFRLICNLYIV